MAIKARPVNWMARLTLAVRVSCHQATNEPHVKLEIAPNYKSNYRQRVSSARIEEIPLIAHSSFIAPLRRHDLPRIRCCSRWRIYSTCERQCGAPIEY